MAQSFYLSSTTSDLGGGADFNRLLATVIEAAGTISVPVAAAATEDSFGYTAAGVPGTNGESGDYTVKINVTTLNANINLTCAVARVDSAGVEQAISEFATNQSADTTGVKTFTFTNPALGTWATGDRLRVTYRFINGALHTSQTVVIGTGTADEEVITPFTASEQRRRIFNIS
jgi:hypothetical protein